MLLPTRRATRAAAAAEACRQHAQQPLTPILHADHHTFPCVCLQQCCIHKVDPGPGRPHASFATHPSISGPRAPIPCTRCLEPPPSAFKTKMCNSHPAMASPRARCGMLRGGAAQRGGGLAVARRRRFCASRRLSKQQLGLSCAVPSPLRCGGGCKVLQSWEIGQSSKQEPLAAPFPHPARSPHAASGAPRVSVAGRDRPPNPNPAILLRRPGSAPIPHARAL